MVLILWISCEGNFFGRNTMKQPEGDGRLHYVSTYLFVIDEIWTIDEYLYNEDGSLARINELATDSSLSAYTLHFYDEEGNCKSTEKYSGQDDTLTEVWSFEYNALGQVTSKWIDQDGDFYGTFRETYEYDSDHFLVKINQYTTYTEVPDRIEYRNDKFGNIIKSYYYSGDGSISNVSDYIYKNNYLIQTESSGSNTYYEYDQNSNLILMKIRPTSAHGSYYHKKDYMYTYY